MKKVAPPPPVASVPKQLALTNGDVLRHQPPEAPAHHRPPMSCTPGEDCAFDELLEGRMDLEVVLPDRRSVKITVDRRTPMMDLLVHVATSNKLTAGNHTIKVLSEDQHSVHYKPNTPIGSLDVNIVYIVPKSSVDIPVRKMPKLANQPFEQTFRLQVNLPRNQRMVLRVSPRITLAELKRQICNEKELEHSSHHLVHPAQPDNVLDLNSTLDVYGCAEISLLSNSGLRDSIHSLSTQLIAYPRTIDEEKRRRGILRLFSKKKKEIPVESASNGVSNQVLPTVRNDGHQPKHSTKRKPAPAPPLPSPPLVIQSSSSINSRPESEISAKTDELGSTVSHSRHSSDSSGYHEPSVFSDCSENKSPEASIVHGGNALSGHEATFCKDVTDCTKPAKDPSNLKTVPSCSNPSIVSATRKRKAPQPPALPEVEPPEDQAPFELSIPQCIAEVPEELPLSKGELERDPRARESAALEETDATTVSQQESEALEYFENVLQESESVNNVEISKLSCDLSVDGESETANSRDAEFARSSSDKPEESDIAEHVDKLVPALESVASPTVSDASEIPSVPSNKDILVKDATMPASENVSDECVASKVNRECIQCINETPSVPNSDMYPVIQKLLRCAGISESAETETNYSDHCSPEIDSVDLKSKADVKSPGSECAPSDEVTTPANQRKLINFAMGCYKNDVKDIFEDESASYDTNANQKDVKMSRYEFQAEVQVHPQPVHLRQAPNVKIVPFEDREVRCISNISMDDSVEQLKQKCPELSRVSTLPLAGRSSSLYNLSPQSKSTHFKPLSESITTDTALSFLKRTLSDQNLSQDSTLEEDKSEFVDEQKRLHEEYLKLQVQFISWQKQLLNNQALLQTEQIVSQMTFPTLEQYKIELEKLPIALQDNVYSEQEDFKTRSLPRPNSRPLSVKEQKRSGTPPAVNCNSKSEVIETSLKHDKAVMSDSGISTEETSDHSNIPSETNEDAVEVNQSSKCQTLPRNVNRPSNIGDTTKTMTLNRQVRPKAQNVSVTIGSWHQRNMTAPDINSAAVASSRSMFQSLENLPREQNKTVPPAPMQRRKTKAANTAKSEDKSDSFKSQVTNGERVADTDVKKHTEMSQTQGITPKMHEDVEKPLFKKPELAKQRSKIDPKSPTESASYKKITKPFIRLSSMKDDPHPPPALHVLKKWPLPEINEKDSKKLVEQSFWEDIAASAKRPTGRSREKVTHAEVDLRRHRSAKSDPSSNTTRNKLLEEPASKIHITKVNIYNAESNSSKPTNTDALKSKPRRSSSALPLTNATPCHPEPFNIELKNVLSKRASALAEPQLTKAGQSNPVEPTYAEARNSHETDAKASSSAQVLPPPPPPPPVSTMPTIPPAAPIPKSSQLLMEKKTVDSASKKQSLTHPRATPTVAPREELMLEIRGFGGRQALRKVPIAQPGWHLKVFGSASTVNS